MFRLFNQHSVFSLLALESVVELEVARTAVAQLPREPATVLQLLREATAVLQLPALLTTRELKLQPANRWVFKRIN